MTGRWRGASLPELLVAVVLIGLGLAAAVPSLADLATNGRAAAGARHLAGTFHGLRWRSVARGTTHGLRFVRDTRGWSWWEVRDGNGNGLRTAEIERGVDPVVAGPHRLESSHEHVSIGFPPAERIPVIPPGPGWIDDLDDPVRFGRSDLVSFSPLGTASSGTIYVTDRRRRLYAVVLYGRSARVRVWRYDTRSGRWRL